MEPPPRTRTLISASNAPSAVVICTPAIFPAKASATEAEATLDIDSDETDAMDPVTSLRRMLP